MMTLCIVQAEERLATVEEHILEKELLNEQVGRLTDWVQKQVNANKTDTLQLAKKVSHQTLMLLQAITTVLSGEQLSGTNKRCNQKIKGSSIRIIHVSGNDDYYEMTSLNL